MERINVDVSKYREAKAAGTAKVVKLNGTVHLIRTTYDSATGKPQPQALPLSREAIENSINDQREALATLEALLDDFDKAPEKLAE